MKSPALLVTATVPVLLLVDFETHGIFAGLSGLGALLGFVADLSTDGFHWKPAASRTGIGIAFGFLFGPYIAEHLALGGTAASVIAAGGLCGLFGWYTVKAVPMVAEKLVKLKLASLDGGKP